MPKKSTIFRRAQEVFLLIQTKSGTEEAFGKIYDQYFQDIYRFIYFKVETKEVAEDIAADVFFKVWQYIKRGKNARNIRALLYHTARNSVIDYHRTRHEQSQNGIKEEQLSTTGDAMEEQIMRAESIEKLHKGLQELKEEYREVILLRYIHELSHKEIGEIIEKKGGAVRVLLHRAIQELKRVLKSDV